MLEDLLWARPWFIIMEPFSSFQSLLCWKTCCELDQVGDGFVHLVFQSLLCWKTCCEDVPAWWWQPVGRVSILVMLEDLLWAPPQEFVWSVRLLSFQSLLCWKTCCECQRRQLLFLPRKVSILVMLEDLLWVSSSFSSLPVLPCFNPCYAGRLAVSAVQRIEWWKLDWVSILVMLEDLLWVS